MLDTCKVENVMDSWAARDSVENGSDSSGNDTSDSGAVGTLIILRLLYPDSCSKCFSLTLVALSCVCVPSRRLLRFVGARSWQPQSVCEKL